MAVPIGVHLASSDLTAIDTGRIRVPSGIVAKRAGWVWGYDENYDFIRGVSRYRFGLDGNCRSPNPAATTDHTNTGR